MTSLPASPPWLSSALLPLSLVLCGHGPAPTQLPRLLPFSSTPLQAHSKWGLCVKISQLFLSLLSTIFIKRSKQSMAEKRENHTALFAKLNRNSNGVGYF